MARNFRFSEKFKKLGSLGERWYTNMTRWQARISLAYMFMFPPFLLLMDASWPLLLLVCKIM